MNLLTKLKQETEQAYETVLAIVLHQLTAAAQKGKNRCDIHLKQCAHFSAILGYLRDQGLKVTQSGIDGWIFVRWDHEPDTEYNDTKD